MEWLESTNTTVPAVFCSSPGQFEGQRIRDLALGDFQCITTGKGPQPPVTPLPGAQTLTAASPPRFRGAPGPALPVGFG